MILSGEVSDKMNRVRCGAVDLSGMIRSETVFKMNTTTSCDFRKTRYVNQYKTHLLSAVNPSAASSNRILYF